MRSRVGPLFLAAYRLWVRASAKAFSVFSSGAFAAFGSGTVIQLPVRLSGEARIAIGSRVFIGAGCWLQALGGGDGDGGDGPALVIGDGTKIVGGSVFSAASSIRIGSKVLMARNAYIADHQHAFSDTSRAVLDQGIERVAPVVIGDGAWLGENVVVGPGVTIGRGSVIGANSVVLRDVPEYSVAVGTPARVVRRLVDDT